MTSSQYHRRYNPELELSFQELGGEIRTQGHSEDGGEEGKQWTYPGDLWLSELSPQRKLGFLKSRIFENVS